MPSSSRKSTPDPPWRTRSRYLIALAGGIALAAGLILPATTARAQTADDIAEAIIEYHNVATGTCLDADGHNSHSYGSIMQWEPCNPDDTYQQWQVFLVGGSGD